ncbi:hypothetical protein IT575_06615 [bacterium]|nr:hypothetical protein [bacterium]
MLAALPLLALCACGSSTAPLDDSGVQVLLERQISIVAEGIEREDAILASQPVGALFSMGGNVALRYGTATFPPAGISETRGLRPFRTFFAEAFKQNANITQSFEVSDFELNGDVATLTVTSTFNATRVDLVPPQNTTAELEDFMVFQREGGTWRLVNWDQVPEETPETPPA